MKWVDTRPRWSVHGHRRSHGLQRDRHRTPRTTNGTIPHGHHEERHRVQTVRLHRELHPPRRHPRAAAVGPGLPETAHPRRTLGPRTRHVALPTRSPPRRRRPARTPARQLPHRTRHPRRPDHGHRPAAPSRRSREPRRPAPRHQRPDPRAPHQEGTAARHGRGAQDARPRPTHRQPAHRPAIPHGMAGHQGGAGRRHPDVLPHARARAPDPAPGQAPPGQATRQPHPRPGRRNRNTEREDRSRHPATRSPQSRTRPSPRTRRHLQRSAHQGPDQNPRVPQRTTGPSSVRCIRATLSSALSDAVAQMLIPVNPAKLIRISGGKRPAAWSGPSHGSPYSARPAPNPAR